MRAAILIAAGIAGLCSGAAYGQAAATTPPAPAARSLTLPVAVETKNGPESGLGANDFTITDNKQRITPQAVRAVRAGEMPMRVVVVLDELNIGLNGRQWAFNQVQRFFGERKEALRFPTTLALVTEKGISMHPQFITDSKQFAALLDQQGTTLRNLTRSTGFWGADEREQISINSLHSLVRQLAGQPGRTVVLWVSPGWPVLSGPDVYLSAKDQQGIFREVVDLTGMMRRGHMTLYALNPLGPQESLVRENYYQSWLGGAEKPRDAELGNLALQVLAEQSGGRVETSNDTVAMLNEAYRDLESFYEITVPLAPAEHPDTLHRLTVRVDRPGTTVLAPETYYAEP